MTVQKVHIVHTSPTPENPGACMWTMWTICFCMVHMCPAVWPCMPGAGRVAACNGPTCVDMSTWSTPGRHVK